MVLFCFVQYPLQLETERPGFILRQLSSLADDAAYFEAVTANVEHLSQFGDTTAQKYQEIDAVTQANSYSTSFQLGITKIVRVIPAYHGYKLPLLQ